MTYKHFVGAKKVKTNRLETLTTSAKAKFLTSGKNAVLPWTTPQKFIFMN